MNLMDMIRAAAAALPLLGSAQLACGSADAATMKAVYSGTVYDSFDETGVFGKPNKSLDGKPFRLTYVYDTNLGTRETDANRDWLKGGALFNLEPIPTPMKSVRLKIQGRSFDMGRNLLGIAFVQQEGDDSGFPDQSFYWHEAIGNKDGGRTSTSVSMDIFFAQGSPASLTLSQTIRPTAQYRNFFQIYDGAPVLPNSYIANGYLDARKLTISPVPLPPALAVMMASLLAMVVVALAKRRHLRPVGRAMEA